LAANDEVVHCILDGLQMLNLIKIDEESHSLEAKKILERFLSRHAEAPPEGTDTGIGIWDLVFAH
jgi:hypothetical protein